MEALGEVGSAAVAAVPDICETMRNDVAGMWR